MRKNLIKSLIFLAGLVVLISPVLAHDDDAPKFKSVTKGLERALERLEEIHLPEVESTKEHPSSFFVGPHGEVRVISAEITSVASTTLGIKVWGLSFNINTPEARFLPQGASPRVGDKVNIKGKIDKNTGVISANTVHLLSSRGRMIDELFRQILKLVERLREIQQKAGLPLTPLPQLPATTTNP